jgi:hypothetical protein
VNESSVPRVEARAELAGLGVCVCVCGWVCVCVCVGWGVGSCCLCLNSPQHRAVGCGLWGDASCSWKDSGLRAASRNHHQHFGRTSTSNYSRIHHRGFGRQRAAASYLVHLHLLQIDTQLQDTGSSGRQQAQQAD